MNRTERFRGLSGNSDILAQRQERRVQEEIYQKLDGVVERCRHYVLDKFQKGQELTGAQLENELASFLLIDYPDLSITNRANIARIVRNELEGYGPLQPLFEDDQVTDIVVINHKRIVYEKGGKLNISDAQFQSDAHMRLFIERFCNLGKRKVDESNPSITLTLPGGYRVAISVPPLSEGAHMAIRKFVYINPIDGLVPTTFSKEAAEFLKLATRGRLNIVFTGPMGSGKTTMIAVLGHEFDQMDLPVLVEEVRECPLEHPNLRVYVARPPNIEGKGEIKFDYILKHALQSRANRILVAEVRDGAIFYMLRAFATGQSGMGTLHAWTPQHAVQTQIPMMLGQAPEAIAINGETRNTIIGSSLDLVVQMSKEFDPQTRTERRVCTHISEIQESSGEPVQVKDIFVRKGGEMIPTGYRPQKLITKMLMNNIDVPNSLFGGRV